MTNEKKSLSQIEYLMDELKREKKEIIKEQAEKKVEEFVQILTKNPAKDQDELKRMLMMLSRDLKNIYEQ